MRIMPSELYIMGGVAIIVVLAFFLFDTFI